MRPRAEASRRFLVRLGFGKRRRRCPEMSCAVRNVIDPFDLQTCFPEGFDTADAKHMLAEAPKKDDNNFSFLDRAGQLRAKQTLACGSLHMGENHRCDRCT